VAQYTLILKDAWSASQMDILCTHMRKDVVYKAMQIAPSFSSLRKWKLNILSCEFYMSSSERIAPSKTIPFCQLYQMNARCFLLIQFYFKYFSCFMWGVWHLNLTVQHSIPGGYGRYICPNTPAELVFVSLDGMIQSPFTHFLKCCKVGYLTFLYEIRLVNICLIFILKRK